MHKRLQRRGICLLLLATFTIAAVAADLKELDWLAGTWVMTKGTRTTEESWLRAAGGMMIGVSRTVAADKVREFEFLRIEQRGTDIFYVAQPGGRPPTEFKLVKSSDKELVFENLQHDFPQQIIYVRNEDGSMTASIKGPGKDGPKTFSFHYQRAK